MQAERIDSMEALRKVIKGNELPASFEIPENFKRKKLEIIIIPLEEEPSLKKALKKEGALSEFARPDLIGSEKTAWEFALRGKHEIS